MKNILSRPNRKVSLLVAALFALLLVAGVLQAGAHNGNGNGNNKGYNQTMYRATNGHYYPYTYHHHQRGYWHQNSNGALFFIVVG